MSTVFPECARTTGHEPLKSVRHFNTDMYLHLIVSSPMMIMTLLLLYDCLASNRLCYQVTCLSLQTVTVRQLMDPSSQQ